MNSSRFVTSSLVIGLISTTSLLGSGSALAKSAASTTFVTPLPHASHVATVVVDNPPARPDAPPSAPAAVVAPTPVVQQAPVVQEPAKREVVHAEVGQSHNYMGTIAVSALMGGVAGALVGGAIYFIDGSQPARNIGYWAAGGVLLGTGVGLAQIMVEESHTSQALSLMPSDPVPTYRLALWRTQF